MRTDLIKNEKINAAFHVFLKSHGEITFSGPNDLEKSLLMFASGWRAYHRQHRGNRAAQRRRKLEQ